MLRIRLILMFASLVMLVSSCFKDDQQITPHVPGKYITDTVALTDTYKYQIYYNLHDSSEVSTFLKTQWDLGFESSAEGWRIVLNSSNFMQAAFLSGQSFGSAIDTTGSTWLFNPSNGFADSIAIGKWFTLRGNDTIGANRLILLDRGIDENGNSLGFRQLVVDSLIKGVYYFRIATLNGNNPQSYSIAKRNEVNHVLFSINNPSASISEPISSEWDLLFTQYTTLLYTDLGEPYPYLLTGVLVNPKYVEVAVDSITPFANVTFDKAQTMSFTKQVDRIGYNWKEYDFDAGSYTVNPDIVYVIRDTKGYLYKLRFIGFYKYLNNKLEKGFPSFEYQKL